MIMPSWPFAAWSIGCAGSCGIGMSWPIAAWSKAVGSDVVTAAGAGLAWPACGSATCFFAAVAGLAAGLLVAGFLTAGFLTGGGVAAGGICLLAWSIYWAETGREPRARPVANRAEEPHYE